MRYLVLILLTCCADNGGSVKINFISVSMEREGRNGYLETVPMIDLLVKHLAEKNTAFVNVTHIPLYYDPRLEVNNSTTPSFYRERKGDPRCAGPQGNIQALFWRFYYQNEAMFNASWEDELTLIVGGACEEAVTELAYATTGIDVPMFIVNPDTRLADVLRFPTVLNMFSMPDPLFISTLSAMAAKYNWSTITVLCAGDNHFGNKICHDMSTLMARVQSSVQMLITWLMIDEDNLMVPNVFEQGLQLAKERRVTLLLFSPNILRHFMMAALQHGLINGDYIFIGFQIVGVPLHEDIYREDDSSVDLVLLKESFKSLFVIADGSGSTVPVIIAFYNELLDEFHKRYNWTMDYAHMNVADPLWLYEQFQVFAQVFLEIEHDIPDMRGREFIERFLNRTYTVATKTVRMDSLGQMRSLVGIMQFSPESHSFQPVMHFDPQTVHINDSTLSWFHPGRKLPPDFPICGLHGEYCWYTRSPAILIIMPALAVLIIVAAGVSLAVIRHNIRQKRLSKLFVSRDEVIYDGATELAYTMQLGQDTSPLGIQMQIRDHKVYCRPLTNSARRYLIRNTKFCRTLITISELHSRFITNFHGLLTESTTCFLVYEATEKATLRHHVERNSRFVDIDLKNYWITNLIEGLVYIHKSPLKYHGMLTIDACLIDSRYTVKICLSGYKHLANILLPDETVIESCDTHQLGLIMAQLFGSANIHGDAVYHRNTTIPPRIHTMIEECLAEETDDKLRNGTLVHQLKYFKSKDNVVELLLRRLDKYAESLEVSVLERTELLIKETDKVDSLLGEIFPKEIVTRLRNRQVILPELFECATVLFSDIPTFAELVAVLHPMKIVGLLSTMHCHFDEIVERFSVYKVETIGDSYVVVSGVPNRNGIQHATEQCTFALSLLQVGNNVRELFGDLDVLAVRIGINSGPVAAGIIGSRMPRYCLFGDAMNTASRMESHGRANMVHVSKSTKILVDEVDPQRFQFEPRGSIPIKGKGFVETFWLLHDSAVLTGG